VTAVATCRRTTGGGRFRATAAVQLEVLTEAAAAGFHLVDLEVETAEAISRAQFDAFRQTLIDQGTGIILSSHDFDATGDLDKTFERLQRFQPDFIKIVSTAKQLTDNVAMMHFLERNSDGANLIGICMGDQGLVSRVLGVRAGSIFTFASATEGEETGPGQIAARTLLETYRIDQVELSTKVYGVVGNPIRQSLSPLMQNTAFRRETVNAVFLALEAKKLSDLLNLVRELPVAGLAVTMPFKQDILVHLEKTDPLSAKIGACNTVVRSQDGRLFGFNTDVGGITRPIERRLPIRGAKILVLGAGGAARAAVFGLVDKGAEVFILNRTIETAQKLARQAKAKTIRRDQVAKTHFDVIVNATPAGMTGQKLTSILEPHELNARLVFDTVYHPIETPLIRAARERGIAVISGVEMFVQQGARQFEIWTGKPAPEEEMMRVVLHALKRRAESAANGAGGRGAQVIPIAPPRQAVMPDAGPSSDVKAPDPDGLHGKAKAEKAPDAEPAAQAKPLTEPLKKAEESPKKSVTKPASTLKPASASARSKAVELSKVSAPPKKIEVARNGTAAKTAAAPKNSATKTAVRAPAVVKKVAAAAAKPQPVLKKQGKVAVASRAQASGQLKKAAAPAKHQQPAKRTVAAAGKKTAGSKSTASKTVSRSKR
jgi:3-dehydroquinate dehydratase/shikimate dehydrogenase